MAEPRERRVRILGTAWTLGDMPVPHPPHVEVWMCNDPKAYRKWLDSTAIQAYTRWFNLHSRAHMEGTYPKSLPFYQQQDKPLYTQRIQQDFPGCVIFPGPAIQAAFPVDGQPIRYFTCSVTWLLAFAAYEGFTHVDLHGFALSDRKPNDAYQHERPCFFYWVQRLRNQGIIVTYPDAVARLPFEPGDPTTYTGPLYGYETKPES